MIFCEIPAYGDNVSSPRLAPSGVALVIFQVYPSTAISLFSIAGKVAL